jgi:hypothetical protein
MKTATQKKYTYLAVIQQNYGFGWEDNSEYQTDSKGINCVSWYESNIYINGVIYVFDEIGTIHACSYNGKVLFAGLDVFENEPTPRKDLLSNSKIAITPHIGAATIEAQDRIGEELAELIISEFGIQN